MRFLVDECTGPAAAQWLRRQNHDVVSVFDEIRGADDRKVIQKAFDQNRILITNDKDFGEPVFREKKPNKGVILLRHCCYRNDCQNNGKEMSPNKDDKTKQRAQGA